MCQRRLTVGNGACVPPAPWDVVCASRLRPTAFAVGTEQMWRRRLADVATASRLRVWRLRPACAFGCGAVRPACAVGGGAVRPACGMGMNKKNNDDTIRF